MSQYFIGTMGFSYSDWKGVFYPSGVPARDYLAQYARIFNSVEMDTTFYAVPRREVVQGWVDAVPEDFRFTVKTPQSITHEMGLEQCKQFMDEFLNVIRIMGEKLGTVLIQLPPSYPSARSHTLATFINDLPKDIRFAVEFRHPSWYTSMTGEFLAAHQIGWVTTEFANLPHQIVPTTDFLYVRWLGKHAAFRKYDHEQVDRSARLAWWSEQIKLNQEKAKQVYGFFNNDYTGFAPAACNYLKTLLDIPVVDFQQPKQGRLFDLL